MKRFAPALRRIAAELTLPRHVRTELLLELVADLEAIYEHHCARGLSPDEAARRAEATVLGSSEMVRRLGELHFSPWRGWLQELSANRGGTFDAILLAAAVVPVGVTAASVSIWVLTTSASAVAWCILSIALLLAVIAVTETVVLLRDGKPRRGDLPTILVLSSLAPCLGFLAPILRLQEAVIGAQPPTQQSLSLLGAIAPEGATLIAGFLLGIVGYLLWFLLVVLGVRRTTREIDVLLNEHVCNDVVSDIAREEKAVIPLVSRRHA